MLTRPCAIHQYTPSITPGDGVSNGVLFTQRLLRDLGFSSEIFAGHIDPALHGKAFPIRDYPCEGAALEQRLLIIHHSIGIDIEEFILSIPDTKVMIYHNITPAEHFPAHHPGRFFCRLGRQQLAAWPSHMRGAIADSAFNAEDLAALGYAPIRVIPLLVDLERFIRAPWNHALPAQLPAGTHLLFIGRIVENKRQHLLLDMLHILRDKLPGRELHLHLVGGISSGDYHAQLIARREQLNLGEHVHFQGHVDDATLKAFYRAADVFVCMSEHEGFGMPLIEAMALDLPVVACNSSNIPNTLGEGGILVPDADTEAMALAVHELFTNPQQRLRVRAAQRRNLQRFQRSHLQSELVDFFAELGFDLGALHSQGQEHDLSNDQCRSGLAREKPRTEVFAGKPAPTVAPDSIQTESASEISSEAEHTSLDLLIEGPFDSSFSLAEVNRQCALALSAEGANIGLHSTEGPGDYPPDPAFLAAHPAVERLWQASEHADHARVVLRNLYPPRVSDIQGELRGMLAYGWEESEFPAAWVDDFNRRLDLITVMSSYVERCLIDCGVQVPIVNVGLGVEHILKQTPQALLDEHGGDNPNLILGHGFRLLHISSAFPRKGVDCLLTAYAQAFTRQDDVCLILKTHPNPHHDIEHDLALWRERYPNAASITLINRDLNPAQILWLYEQCHAVVQPSRGEGFGLPIAEAMLLNLPVITTAHGGQLDFCNHDTAWLVDFRYARAESHFNQYGSVWAEPDINDLARQMRAVVEATPEASFQRVMHARERIRQHFTWQRSAQRIQQAIADVKSRPLRPPAPRIGWVSTFNSACGIAEYSRYLLDNWPQPDEREAMRIYADLDAAPLGEEPAELRRVWRAKHLDPDMGALEAALRADGIDTLFIQFNFSFFELHALAGMIERLCSAGMRIALTLHSTADVMHDEQRLSLRVIAPALAKCERIYVHGIDDLNRLKDFGLNARATRLPHGVPVGAALAANEPCQRRNPSRPRPLLQTTSRRSDLGRECPNAPPHVKPVLGANTPLLATFGFLLPHKGLAEWLHAFSWLRKDDPTLRLLMLNSLHPAHVSTLEHQRLLALIAELGLGEAVELCVDYLPEAHILQRLAKARLIVFPYQHTQESSSAAVRLGLASGTPVACTPLPIFDDLEDAVYRLPGADMESLAHGVRALLDLDPAEQTRQSEAQSRWLNAHAWPRIAQRMSAWAHSARPNE